MADSYASAAGLHVRVEDAVLRFTLNAPERRNALTDGSTAALIRALEQACTDDEPRGVLLEGSGPDFCSGFDIVARNAGGPSEEKPRRPTTACAAIWPRRSTRWSSARAAPTSVRA